MAARITVTASGSNGLAAALAAAKQRARQLPGTLAGAVSEPASAAVLDGARARRGTLSISGIHARLGVHASTSGGDGHATLELSATPRGAWALATKTKSHLERPRRKEALRLSDGGFAALVHHPGDRRVDVWGAAKGQAARVIPTVADRAAAAHNPFRGG